jgi:hypothetical protein
LPREVRQPALLLVGPRHHLPDPNFGELEMQSRACFQLRSEGQALIRRFFFRFELNLYHCFWSCELAVPFSARHNKKIMHLDEECQESQAKIDTYWLCCGVAAILRIHRKLSSDALLPFAF